jgi:thioredoxin-related protein
MRFLPRLPLAALLVAPALALAASEPATREVPPQLFTADYADYRAALAAAEAAGKLGAVAMFHWNGCPYCERMKRDVLGEEAVRRWYGERFVTFAVDTRSSRRVRDFDGNQPTERAFATESGVRITPTFIFYSRAGTPLYVHRGAIRDPAQFIRLGEYVADGAYRTQSFDVYSKVPTSKGNP